MNIPTDKKIYNRREIEEFLVHRGTMLLLDSAWDGGASYTFRGDEFFFDGHFPGEKIVPVAILVEILAQSTCTLMSETQKGSTGYLVGINGVKIKKKVLPGDVFVCTSLITKKKGPMYIVDCKGFVEGKEIIRASLTIIQA